MSTSPKHKLGTLTTGVAELPDERIRLLVFTADDINTDPYVTRPDEDSITVTQAGSGVYNLARLDGPTYVLDPVTDLAGTASGGTVTLTWTDQAGVVTHQVQKKLTSQDDTGWADYSTAVAAGVETKDVSGLTPSTSYDFRLISTDGYATTISQPYITVVSGATLVAGSLAAAATGSTSISVSLLANPSGGTPPYTLQLYGSTSNGFTPGGGNLLSGKTSLPASITGLTVNVPYYVRCIWTDSAGSPETATSAQVTATPISVVLYPNRPANSTQLTQWNGTTISLPTGWGGTFNGYASVQADGGGIVNPLGTGASIKINYPSGTRGLGAILFTNWGGAWSKLYIMYRIYIDPIWNESYGQKMFYVSDTYNTQQNSYYFNRSPGTGFTGSKQVGNIANYIFNSTYWSGARGVWTNVEILMERETTPGSSNDAQITLWKNGSLVSNSIASKANPATAVGPMGNLKGMEWYLQRNDNHTQTEYFLIGEIGVWGIA